MYILFKDSALSLVSRIFVLGAAVLTSVLISRTLGASLQGTYNVFVLIANTATVIFSLSASVASIILGAREPEHLPHLLGNALLMALAAAAVSVVTLLLLFQIPAVQMYLLDNGVEELLTVGILLMVPVIMLSSFLREIIRAAGQITLYNIIMALPYLLNFVFLLAAIFLQPGMLNAVVVGWMATQIITALLTTFLAWRSAGFRLGVDIKLLRFSLGYGARSHLGVVTHLLNYRLDVFLIGVFLPTDFIGYYTIATLYAERIWEFPSAIRTALLYHASANVTDAPQITAQTTRISMLFVTLATVGLVLISYPFITLVHGEAYQPAVLPLIVLMPGVWMLSLGKLLGVYIASVNRPEIGTYAGVISLFFTLILDLWLIPLIGIPGAALASSIAYSISTLIIASYFLRMTHLSWIDVSVIRRSDILLLRRAIMRIVRPTTRPSESII